MVSSSAKRRAIQAVVEQKVCSIAQGCRTLKLARSVYYLRTVEKPKDMKLIEELKQLSLEYPRYGYRRITIRLREQGWCVNHKRVQRLRRHLGLEVRGQFRKTGRLNRLEVHRQTAREPNEIWCWDFIADQTQSGRRLKLLTLIDEYTRRCLTIRIAYSLRTRDVMEELQSVMQRYGVPSYLRSDNGPEFIAQALQRWLRQRQTKTLYIRPGSPWENPYIESFHSKLRDECLNRELFGSLREAQVVVEAWRKEYNEKRPHSSLGYQTPKSFAEKILSQPRLGQYNPKNINKPLNTNF